MIQREMSPKEKPWRFTQLHDLFKDLINVRLIYFFSPGDSESDSY